MISILLKIYETFNNEIKIFQHKIEEEIMESLTTILFFNDSINSLNGGLNKWKTIFFELLPAFSNSAW